MSDALYERYKDALRRGHVAALRGRLDAAVVAYGEAAELAPERALPHASLGGVLVRIGRPDDALAAFGRALERAPFDEAALRGRAEALVTLGHAVEAADTLDRLSEIEETAGRLVDASDTARRALELAESRTRRRQVESLVARLRETPADAAAAAALERAMRILEPPEASPAPEPEPELPSGAALAAEAEDRLDAGDDQGARDGLLAAAAAHRRTGQIDAALDACYLALALAPDDQDLHLTLAELYLDRGWHANATDKLLLLGRLADLAGDDNGRRRICAIVAARLPDEPKLAALCA